MKKEMINDAEKKRQFLVCNLCINCLFFLIKPCGKSVKSGTTNNLHKNGEKKPNLFIYIGQIDAAK